MHIYGSCRSRLDFSDWGAVVSSGGSATAGLTVNIYAQIGTRAGKNLLSAAKNITIEPGDKLTLTINEDAIKSGEDAFEIIFSAENTTASDAAQIAKIKLRDSDQVTKRTLPISLELTLDSHLALAATIATSNDLPDNPVNGQMRQIGADYYEYDSEALAGDYQSGSGYWKQVDQTFSTYLSATNASGGCDYPQSLITGLKFAPPVYPGDGSDHTPLRIWLLNGLSEDGQAQIPIGSAIALETKVNDSTQLATSLSGGIKVRVLGYVRRSTGFLDTSIAEANIEYNWDPNSPLFNLTTALPRGYALAVEIILSFLKSQLRGGITGGESISTILYTQGKLGNYNPIGFFTGNAIASLDDRMRILPTIGGFKRASGLAIINNYVTPRLGEDSYPVVVADTADQQIALSGVLAGDAFVYQSGSPIPSSQGLRAKFSTVTGEQTPSDWSNPVTLVTGQILQLTIDHPANSEGFATIRGDYPDSLIAGLNTEFTAPYFRLFLEIDGTIYQSDTLTLAAQTDTQQITIDAVNGFSVIGSLPSQPDSAFGFWNYGARTLASATGSGSLTTGVSIRFALAYAYPSPNLVLTKIAHEGLEEISYTLIEAITRSGAYGKVSSEGLEKTQRGTLDFNDPLVSISDDPLNDRTRISLPAVRNVYFSTSAPTVDDDGASGYRQGDRWHYYTGSILNASYVCLGAANGAALWPSLGTGENSQGSGLSTEETLTALKALTGVANNSVYLLASTNNIYRYDASSTATPNDDKVIITAEKNQNPLLAGRFLKVGTFSASEITPTTARNFVTDAELLLIDTIADKAEENHLHITSKGSLLTSNGTAHTQFPVPDGKYVMGDGSTESGLIAVDPPGSIATRTKASYTQPSLNQTVILQFSSTQNFVANQTYVAIETGGIYLITNIGNATTATAEYKGFGVNPTTQVQTNRKVSLTGRPGDPGASALTLTVESFTTPAISEEVTIDVISATGANLGSFVDISTAGNYKVTGKDETANPNTLTVENLGGNNTSAGVTIAANSQVTVAGPPGPIGSVAATSSINYQGAIPPPNTEGNQWKTFIDSLNNNKYSFKENSNGLVKIFAFISDILATTLTGLSLPLNPTEILATDTIIEALGKAQKYFVDFLTTFNVADKLVKLDANGFIPKLNGSKITENVIHPVAIDIVADGTYRILAYPSTVVENIRYDGIYDLKTDNNVGTLSIAIDGTFITEFDNLSVTTTGANYTTTGENVLHPGDSLFIILNNSDTSNPMTKLSFTLYGVKNP